MSATSLRTQPAALQPPLTIRPRDVRGNIAGSWGRVLRPPASDALRRQYEENLRAAGEEAVQEAEGGKERHRLAVALEFEESTRAKIMHGQAKALAEASVRAVQLDLQKRRNTLRQLLVSEGLQTEGELSEQAARTLVDRLQEARSHAALLKQRTEQERQQVVAAALEKQDRDRIEPLRRAERAALTLACKEINLGQIRDKQEQQEADREEQRMQHAMQVKTLQAQMAREEQDCREELARKKAMCDALQQQVEYQRQREDRLREEELAEGVQRLNRLREELHQERLAELQRRRQQREALQRLFDQQIRERERALAEQADREAAVDEAVARKARQQIQQELADRSKADAAAEMKMFMANAAALRRQQELADLEEQRVRDAHVAYMQREQDDRRCRVEAARKKILQDTLVGRRQQLELAEAQRAGMAQKAADEARRLERCREENLRLAADLQRRKEEEKKKYAEDLQSQIQYQRLLKERQVYEARLEKEQAEVEEKRYQERVKQLLQNPQKYATHPFRLKIEGRALAWPE